MADEANKLTEAIMLAVNQRWPKCARLWRTPNFARRDNDGTYLRVSMKGISDLCGLANGIFVAIEVKTASDRVSKPQQIFLNMIRRFGGIAIVGRSPEQVVRELEEWIK